MGNLHECWLALLSVSWMLLSDNHSGVWWEHFTVNRERSQGSVVSDPLQSEHHQVVYVDTQEPAARSNVSVPSLSSKTHSSESCFVVLNKGVGTLLWNSTLRILWIERCFLDLYLWKLETEVFLFPLLNTNLRPGPRHMQLFFNICGLFVKKS